MFVGVHMVEGEAGGPEGGELGFDFRGQLAPGRGVEKHRRAGRRHVGAKFSRCVDQVANLTRRK